MRVITFPILHFLGYLVVPLFTAFSISETEIYPEFNSFTLESMTLLDLLSQNDKAVWASICVYRS